MTEASSPAAASPTTTPAAAPAAAPSAPGTSAGSAPSSDIYGLLGDGFKGDKSFEKFKDVPSLAKSYKELEGRLSQPRFDVPGSDAAPEVQAAFWQKMGVPGKPEEYGLKSPQGYPEHMGEYNQEVMAEFAKTAHGLKLTPAQAAGLQSWYDTHAMKLISDGQAAKQAETDQANAALTGHFSKLFGDQSAAAVESVKQTMIAAIPDAELRTALEKTLPDEALVALAAIDRHYKKTYGQSDQNQGDPGSSSSKSLEDLRKDAQKLMSSAEYRDAMHKDHKATRDRVDQMYKDIGTLTENMRKK